LTIQLLGTLGRLQIAAQQFGILRNAVGLIWVGFKRTFIKGRRCVLQGKLRCKKGAM
tara:strand:- start:1023 stop:1193 length:171 start_codon:yes stop_codon:yes gene_type:complete